MNILYVAGSNNFSDRELEQLRQFFADLAPKKIQLTLMHPATMLRSLSNIVAKQTHVNYVCLPAKLADEHFAVLHQLQAIREALKAQAYDVIHVDIHMLGLTLVASVGLTLPIVVNVSDGYQFNWVSSFWLKFKRIRKVILRSEDDRDHAMEEGRLQADKLIVNYDQFFAGQVDATNSKTRRGIVGIPNDGFIIGVGGTEKGRRELEDTITVFDHLRSRHPHLYLVLAGISRVDLRAKHISLTSYQLRRIRFVGQQCLENGDYSLFDIFCVITSPAQGVSWLIKEVMAHQVPVVAFDMPGSRELIQPMKTGLLVPSNDVDALHDTLDFAIQNYSQCAEFASNAHTLIAQSMSHQARTQSFLDIYRQVIQPTVPSLVNDATVSQ